MIRVNSEQGLVTFGPFRLSWGNPLEEYDLSGFCLIAWGSWALEFGDLDQGRNGIYLTQCVDDEIIRHRTLLEL